MFLTHLLATYRPGSYDPPWTWDDEKLDLITRETGYMTWLAMDIARNGIREPVEIHHGERRVWNGHHRIVIAWIIGLRDVPIVDATYSDTGRVVTGAAG